MTFNRDDAVKMFYAVCKKMPITDDIQDKNSYTIGKNYVFRYIEPRQVGMGDEWVITECTDDTGIRHRMSFQYFNEFFSHVDTEVML